MEVKTVELPGGIIINIILNKTYTFLFPITELAEAIGLPKTRNRTSNLTAMTKCRGFVENTHYIVHQKGHLACYKNLKPGTRLLTRLGLAVICNSLKTKEAKIVAEWASKQTYDRLTQNERVFELFKSILFDVSKINDPILKKRLQEKINTAYKYI